MTHRFIQLHFTLTLEPVYSLKVPPLECHACNMSLRIMRTAIKAIAWTLWPMLTHWGRNLIQRTLEPILAYYTVAQNAISEFPLYICDSLDAFTLRSVQFTPAHANTILSMLFLFARYNSRLPMLILFSRCFFSSLGTSHSCPC